MTLDLTGELARRRGRGRAVVAVLLLLAGLGAGAWWYRSRPPAPDEAARDFAAAWDAGDPGEGPVTADATASWARIRDGVGEAEVDVALTGVTVDEDDDATAAAQLELSWALPGERTWRYATTAPMRLGDDGWTVVWSPTVAHPELVVPDEEPLPEAVAAELPGLMRAVVTDGSGTALADVPGEPVHAKTGTAEYGDGSPPRTHAWVTGYQGDLAFAVLVAETPDAFGGRVAAPLAAELLTRPADG